MVTNTKILGGLEEEKKLGTTGEENKPVAGVAEEREEVQKQVGAIIKDVGGAPIIIPPVHGVSTKGWIETEMGGISILMSPEGDMFEALDGANKGLYFLNKSAYEKLTGKPFPSQLNVGRNTEMSFWSSSPSSIPGDHSVNFPVKKIITDNK